MSSSGERIETMRPPVHLDVRDWQGVLYVLERHGGTERGESGYLMPEDAIRIAQRVRRQVGGVVGRK